MGKQRSEYDRVFSPAGAAVSMEQYKKQAQQNLAKNVDECMKQLCEGEVGRAFLTKILDFSMPDANPFTGNSATYYNCGRMEPGQKLKEWIGKVDPEALGKIVQEKYQ